AGAGGADDRNAGPPGSRRRGEYRVRIVHARYVRNGHTRSAAGLRRALLGHQHEARNATALDEMLLQNLVEILGRAIGVPNAFRIDHHGRAQLAAVEAARGIDANITESSLLRAGLEIVAQPFAALVAARSARMTRRTDVGAAENVARIKGLRIVH